MDMFAGKTLIRADGSEHPAEEALCDVKVVALYFSAHWCPPYHSEEDMVKYMDECHGNWYAIKYEDPWREELARKYVTGIPTLIVFKMDGTVISSCGREEVQDQGPEVFRRVGRSGVGLSRLIARSLPLFCWLDLQPYAFYSLPNNQSINYISCNANIRMLTNIKYDTTQFYIRKLIDFRTAFDSILALFDSY
ncbi:hypothetical protein MRX96_021081 [Rhipicephalus microplus]